MFTKILKPLEKHWRHQDVCVAVFLDDGLDIEKDSQVCSIQCGYLARGLIGWASLGIALVEPLKLLIGGLPK